MSVNQLHEPNIEGKRVSNYRYNVYANFEHGDFKCLDVIWVVSTSSEIAEGMALNKGKELYPNYNVSVMLTN